MKILTIWLHLPLILLRVPSPWRALHARMFPVNRILRTKTIPSQGHTPSFP